jgi:Zinc-binding dehydrogenase
MKLLLCPSPSRQPTSPCTTKTLMDSDWFHLYMPRVRASTLETPFSLSVDPVPLARMVSCDITALNRDLGANIHYQAIQLAKLSGFSLIITTASLKHAENLKSIGATHVIDRSLSNSDLASMISRITRNVPIKYAVDSISTPDTQQMAYDLLAPGGQLAIFSPLAAKRTKKKDIVQVHGILRLPANIELLETLYHDHFERLLREGAIKVSRSRQSTTFCLTEYDSQIELKYCRTVLRGYQMG